MAGRPNEQLCRVSGNNKNTMMKSKVVVIIFIVILLLAAGVYFIFFKERKPEEGARGEYGGGINFNIGIDVSGIGEGTENALENMPPTNPLEGVANPFRDTYKNPFE